MWMHPGYRRKKRNNGNGWIPAEVADVGEGTDFLKKIIKKSNKIITKFKYRDMSIRQVYLSYRPVEKDNKKGAFMMNTTMIENVILVLKMVYYGGLVVKMAADTVGIYMNRKRRKSLNENKSKN